MASSLVSVLLIPPDMFQPGGTGRRPRARVSRARAARHRFGTVYDISTIAILWFAGASAMAGLLNLVPRYLPRYGMAPEWARANRPLVALFTGITIFVTIIFRASVDAQAGAYATGVLVLMSSAAVAVAITAWRQQHRWALFVSITVVFIYTSVTNIFERPEGIKIASVFILSIVVTSLVSRTLRSTELRVLGVEPDPLAEQFIDEAARGEAIRIIANRPGAGDRERVRGQAARGAARRITCRPTIRCCFSRWSRATRRSSARCCWCGASGWTAIASCAARARRFRMRSRRCCSTSAIGPARSRTCTSDGRKAIPITYLLKFLAFGEGDTAPVTREVLRQAEADPLRRPRVHVG